MKIGILTYFGAHNYGAFLQAYALRSSISQALSCNVELINYRMQKEINAYCLPKRPPLCRPKNYFKLLRPYAYGRLQWRTFEKSIVKYQTLSKENLVCDSTDAFAAFIGDRYDLIIAGSDEIWKTDGFRSFPNAYWLPGIDCTKMAYAVSSRNTKDRLTPEQISFIEQQTRRFDYIGARDAATLRLIADVSGEPGKCRLNCDPTFLYDFPVSRENGKRILRKKFKVKSNKRIVGLAFSDAQYGQRIVQHLGHAYEVVSLSSLINGAKNYAGLTPFDWIDVIAACDMMITSRFHGTVFSIKCGKPFLAIETEGYSQETSKLFDLLNRNSLTRFYAKDGTDEATVFNQIIPDFLAFAERVNYTVDYQAVIENEKQTAASFFTQLHRYIS